MTFVISLTTWAPCRLPTRLWGTLRHGIELYALATLVNLAVFVLLFVLYLLLRTGLLRLGVPEE